jgi:hypothetical protein
MGKADGSRVVGGLGLLQRAAVMRDCTRLVSASGSQTTVEAPECGQAAGRHGFAKGIRRTAKGAGGLVEVILKQPGLRERRPNREFVLAGQRRGSHDWHEQLRRLGSTAPLERGPGTSQKRL